MLFDDGSELCVRLAENEHRKAWCFESESFVGEKGRRTGAKRKRNRRRKKTGTATAATAAMEAAEAATGATTESKKRVRRK